MLKKRHIKYTNAENNKIGLIKISLSDFPDAHSIINSLSFFNLFIFNNTDKNREIGIVSRKILGKSKIIYDKYDINDTLSAVNSSMCLSPWPSHKIPLKRININKKLEEISLIAYVVNLDIFSIISIFC